MLRTALLLAAVSLAPTGIANQTITVSAAISLTNAMEAIARAYSAPGGGDLTFNFAASNVLARQIINGAPVDVFISADEAQMDLVSKAAMIETGSRVAIVHNQLAVIMRTDATARLTSAAGLSSPAIRRIAVGDPPAVPAGVYAKEYLQRSGVWSALEKKLLPAASVRAALAAVENGAADAGIVYVTDARAAKGARLAFVIDGPEAPQIVYPACVVRTSTHKSDARRFLNFLASAEAARIFREHGFLPVAQNR